jgi:hypothetical protein
MIALCWFQQIKQVTTLSLFVKNYYYECLLNELGFTSTSGNTTYTRTNLTKDEILQNDLSVLNTFNIPKNQDQFNSPYLYWILKLHKNPYKDALLVPVNALLSHYLYYSLNY